MHVSLSNSLAGQCTNIFHSEYTSRLYFSLEASPYITLLIFFLIEIFFIELSDCPHGWTNVAGKCFKLICREYSWRNARVKCLKAQADLASLHDENSLRSITQYLERILAHLSDSTRTMISVGLTRTKRRWSWLDGQQYNGTLGYKSFTADLVWKEKDGKWDFEESRNVYYNKLHLCVKSRGI